MAWFIVLLALATSYYMNGYKSHKPTINSRETDRKYAELDNYEKVSVDLSITNLVNLKKMLDTTVLAMGAEKLYRDEQSGFALYLYQVEPKNVETIVNSFSTIGTITHKTESINTESSQVNLEGKLKDKETLYQKEFQEYSNSKSKFSFQLNRINQLSKDIDSLKYSLENQKSRAMTLLYVKAIVVNGKQGKIHDYKAFFLDFLKFFVGFTVLGLLIYYGVVVLNYLLGLLGIKLPSLNPYKSGGTGYSGYSGYSGYGNKGYGGYSYGKNRKRRIKRIYRNKSGADDSSEDEKE